MRAGIWRQLARMAWLGLACAAWGGGGVRIGYAADPEAAGAPRVVLFEPRIEGGTARMALGRPGESVAYLIVVSTLAREAGPYPFWMAARSTARPVDDLAAVPAWTPRRVASRARQGQESAHVEWGGPPPQSDFFILAEAGDPSNAENYSRVDGALRAVGRDVQVYVDRRDLAAVNDDTLRDIVASFDGPVHQRANTLFGPVRDVDGDGRFTVLMSGALQSLGAAQAPVDGFVRGADFDLSLAAPFSNRRDMMCLNTRLRSGPHLRTVIAHEYTHAITFCRKVLDSPNAAVRIDEEGWLDEALAHLVEDLHGFSRSNLDHRVAAYLASPEKYRLLVTDYYADSLFRSHGHRGSAYLFLRWCADQHGPELLPALVCSKLTGTANLEAATGTPFDVLFRHWSVEQYLRGYPQPDGVNVFPRATPLAVDGAPDRWVAQGTTCHYAIVTTPARGAGAVEVDVIAPPQAKLQVTIVRLPPATPRRAVPAR